ncbi:hypothetical protein, partial [Micromonospora sp. LOL_021]|uniref:hypothetical protein n=1 Tax=Micromonospora sp. LOL_021 TaxID=3345417 RepID=UPI003A8A93C3
MRTPSRWRGGAAALTSVALVAVVLLGASPAAARYGGPAGPTTPTTLWASTNGVAINLTWQQPPTGPRIHSFRVYEGGEVVARTSTTSTMMNVAFGSSHTYTVTAVDRHGRESAPTDPVTGRS